LQFILSHWNQIVLRAPLFGHHDPNSFSFFIFVNQFAVSASGLARLFRALNQKPPSRIAALPDAAKAGVKKCWKWPPISAFNPERIIKINATNHSQFLLRAAM
jgi:hypothetical protein